jgi:hypothetical protein
MGRCKRPCPLPVQSRVNRLLAVIANRKRITREIRVRFDRRPSIRQQCVSADLFLRKDTTWTTRTCFPIPTHRNMSLRAKPPGNQPNTRRSRTGPKPRLPRLHRNDRERLCGRSTLRSSGADHFGPRPGRRHRRCMVAAFTSVAAELPQLIGALHRFRRDRRHQNQLVDNRRRARSGLDGSRRLIHARLTPETPAFDGDQRHSWPREAPRHPASNDARPRSDGAAPGGRSAGF